MSKKYILQVRDRITIFNLVTDSILEAYGCYYESPVFLWDGTLASADTIIDKYLHQFCHMINWTATFEPV